MKEWWNNFKDLFIIMIFCSVIYYWGWLVGYIRGYDDAKESYNNYIESIYKKLIELDKSINAKE